MGIASVSSDIIVAVGMARIRADSDLRFIQQQKSPPNLFRGEMIRWLVCSKLLVPDAPMALIQWEVWDMLGYSWMQAMPRTASAKIFTHEFLRLRTRWRRTLKPSLRIAQFPFWLYLPRGLTPFDTASNQRTRRFSINYPMWGQVWMMEAQYHLVLFIEVTIVHRTLEEKNDR